MNNNVPKLTFALRCFIFAAHRVKGYTYPQLAKAFNVNAENIGKICRSNSRSAVRYLDVAKEADRMGVEQMFKHYTSPELEQRVDNVRFGQFEPYQGPSHQKDTGPGFYWFKNRDNVKVPVQIKHLDAIRNELVAEDWTPKPGYYVNDPKFGWSMMIPDHPFETIQEAIRYFEDYPPEWVSYPPEW